MTDFSVRHLRFGWWSLLVFTTLGLGLESLHAFKIGAYLGVGNDTRRLMWTLAHAHGTLLAVVNVVYGLSLRTVPEISAPSGGFVSVMLIGAGIVLPGGFFVGGIAFNGADPWPAAAVLIPVGGTLLLLATFFIARTKYGPSSGAKRKR
jgi:hypothetical protein